ncbi:MULTISPECIES: hypothetical protein [unclassified Streptomyces]|uniref:hypothetical protein n=1 Tax=unclassified Streptomyces TaxID=2593676 RepID=UPI00382C49EE
MARPGRAERHAAIVNPAVPVDGRSEFDFIFARRRVRNRKLMVVTDPSCEEWIEFDATSEAEPILGGLGLIDRIWTDNELDHQEPVSTVRRPARGVFGHQILAVSPGHPQVPFAGVELLCRCRVDCPHAALRTLHRPLVLPGGFESEDVLWWEYSDGLREDIADR